MKKSRLYIGLAVFFGIIFVAGITAVAVTNFGSQSNPLVTKSYMDDVVMPNILSSASSAIDEKAQALENKFIDSVNSFSAGNISAPVSFNTVTLKNSQVIKCSAGTEIIVRSGSATCYGGTAPRLVDTTTGLPLETAGAEMTLNHMYLVPYDNNGLRARSDNTVILVGGEYTVYTGI